MFILLVVKLDPKNDALDHASYLPDQKDCKKK